MGENSSLEFTAEDLNEQKRQRVERFNKLYYRHISDLAIISVEPAIFYLPIDLYVEWFADSYKFLFNSLKHRKIYIICPTYSFFEKEKSINKLKDLIEDYKNLYPNFEFSFLANTPNQNQLFNAKSLKTILCSHNCFVDENLFFPISRSEKLFDAVYDARFEVLKNHYLARQIDSLGLIYLKMPYSENSLYVEKTKNDFAFAKFFNHFEENEYKNLTPSEVNQALNQCRVGLCLSAEEGAMYASIQYLLAGLPVVTIPSLGGRDLFFDEEISVTVEPNPEAVKKGVEKIIGQNIPANFIREKTLEKMKEHRQRFINLVQEIYDKESTKRNFIDDFKKTFSNKLLKRVNHHSVVSLLLSENS